MSEQSERTEQQQVVAPPAPETPPSAVPQAPVAPGTPVATETPVASETVVAPETPVAPPAKKDRRVLRAFLRWTAAVAVFAVAGGATAYGITRMERTDVPGLATASDGRWEYPKLSRPPLPSGSPGPFAEQNKAGAHYADLRALVLPAPAGAKADKALRGEDGWLATKDFLTQYASKDDREEFAHKLTDNGLRHIAAAGWTTRDGTRTRIYLLQFDTAAVVDDLNRFATLNSPDYPVRGAELSVFDDAFPSEAKAENVERSVYVEAKPYGAEQVRHAYLSAGDTLALIVQSRKGGAKAVPFQQTVALQSELLG
ncbi:hypothetical protein ACFOZ0_07970 [Streptomyces yaanensis]|uniref:Uncharacterized protein n=1 Tax=Streptomyces yaanensis TaxID=1142239 RepID=A0ABV7SAB8_9ACTN|nr:hypothetical protein [Streptomyces sp. CGMCC 4.7035]WNC02715.1 hypothetical protein Q2K21_34240 [Streptomyces sp. CGMCC 4.7035]